MFKLVIVHKGRIEKNIPLRHENMTIGRKPQADIRLEEKMVSGMHARVMQNDDGVIIEDLDSTNGTKVNGEFINSTTLQTGDQISIGNYKLIFITEREDSDDPDATVIASPQAPGRSTNDKPAASSKTSGTKVTLIVVVLIATSLGLLYLLI